MKQVRRIRQKLSQFWLRAETKTLHWPRKRSGKRSGKRKRNRRLGRAWKLAPTLVLIGLLFFLSWYLQGCPCFSKDAAFRKALRGIGHDGVPLELTIDRWSQYNRDVFCLGTDGKYAYAAAIKEDARSGLLDSVVTWQQDDLDPGRRSYLGGACACAYPTVDGVCFVPGMWEHTSYADFTEAPTEPDENGWISEADDGEFNWNYRKIAKETYGFVLVRVPAARIEMTMVLEPRTDEGRPKPGGAFAMKTERLEGDWFRCDFDPEYVPIFRAYDGKSQLTYQDAWEKHHAGEPIHIWEREDETGRTGVPDLDEARDYYYAVERYADGAYDDRVHFVLTAYDENDKLIQTVTCDPQNWDRGF